MVNVRGLMAGVSRVARGLALAGVVAAAACDEAPTTPSDLANDDRPTAAASGGGSSSPATLTATRFLAFGDSMTHGEVTGATGGRGILPMNVVPAASFPTQLQNRLQSRYRAQAGTIAVTNAGRSGELAVDGASLARLAELLANSQTQALLLLHGSNDLLDFGAGAVGPTGSAMNRLAREGRQRGARVFIALLPPPIAGRQRSVDDSVVRAFNGELRAIAAGEGAVVVDLYTSLSADVSRFIGPDGHHPTEAGYQRIADTFQDRIAAELERR